MLVPGTEIAGTEIVTLNCNRPLLASTSSMFRARNFLKALGRMAGAASVVFRVWLAMAIRAPGA